MSNINRKVYVVICYIQEQNATYISEVCSSKKKAEEHIKYISGVMGRQEPDVKRHYWVYDARVV